MHPGCLFWSSSLFSHAAVLQAQPFGCVHASTFCYFTFKLFYCSCSSSCSLHTLTHSLLLRTILTTVLIFANDSWIPYRTFHWHALSIFWIPNTCLSCLTSCLGSKSAALFCDLNVPHYISTLIKQLHILKNEPHRVPRLVSSHNLKLTVAYSFTVLHCQH